MNYPKSNKRIFKDENPNAVLRTFFALVFFIVAGFYGYGALMGCQKEVSSLRTPVIESDHDLMPPGGYYTEKRVETEALQMASKKANPGKGKGKPQPPTDTTGGGGEDPQDPPPTNGQGVILLDFDGQYISGSYWNVNGPIDARYSGMQSAEIAATLARVQEDYAPFAVTVTMDTAVYFAAPVNKRVRVIITESYEWYGMAGGVAYLGSFSWGDNTPAWVFSSLLGYNAKYIADAATHEAGHTFGLRHVPEPDGSSAYCTYGNHMGVAYYVPIGFFESYVKDRFGYVNQFDIIKSNL